MANPHEQALAAIREEILAEAEQRSSKELDLGRERADRYTEDCLFEARRLVERARTRWEAVRQTLSGEADLAQRLKARSQLEKAEREYRRKLTALRDQELTSYSDKDRALAELSDRAKVTERRTLVASAYFWVS
jgi:hypothetical protein